MTSDSATSISHPNIAFIKYWGDRDKGLRLPASGSISMTLAGLETRTTVAFQPTLDADRVTLNGQPLKQRAQGRVVDHLGLIRELAGISAFAEVDSRSNFPVGAGLASSASAFAALSLAGSQAAGLELSPRELSRLARRGSGSAARSVFGGFVECLTGDRDEDAYAIELADQAHWKLVDWIALVQPKPKEIGSSEGHALAATSPVQPARLATATQRLHQCREAIRARDFEQLAEVSELDSNLMHAVMITSQTPLLYWGPGSLRIMREIGVMRSAGLPVFYTVDAGPNVHCICAHERADAVGAHLQAFEPSIRWLRCEVGEAARLVESY